MRIVLTAIVTGVISTSALVGQAAPQRSEPKSLIELSGEIQTLARRVSPAVVQVLVTGYGPFNQPPGNPVSLFGRQQTIGSGVIVDSQGYIMTNAHVVSNAVNIRIVFASQGASNVDADGGSEPETSEAKIVGLDAESDLALLKIERKGLATLEFMNSDDLRQGDLVLALGAPMGLQNSLSLGVVSAPARSLTDDDSIVYVQTDASINPGNSGGALVSATGRLAGLNTFILSQSGGNEGLGFAIPANTVRDVYQQLRENGQVKRGEIGVSAQNINPVMAKGLSLVRDHGVILADVEPDSPAAKVDLKRGDIIVTVDGRKVQSMGQLGNHIFRRKAGDTVQLGVLRGQTELTVSLVVRERADPNSILARLAHPEKNLISRLGILCIEIDKDIAPLIAGLRRQYGLIVAAKSPGGQAQFVDLQPGDIIDAVNTVPVFSLDGLRSKLDDMKPGDAIVLQIERDGRFRYLAFELDR